MYRARDTKLGREVALKLLLEEVASDPERLARFEREARVLASLNHTRLLTGRRRLHESPAPCADPDHLGAGGAVLLLSRVSSPRRRPHSPRRDPADLSVRRASNHASRRRSSPSPAWQARYDRLTRKEIPIPKMGGKWGHAEFFSTGEREVIKLLTKFEELGIDVEFGSVLDFGCGVGRVSRALSERFSQVIAVDVSSSMLKGSSEGQSAY